MLIIPAIDIKDGKVVRLFKGQFDKVTEYGADPLEMAKRWENMGARYLHVVDLDGAKSGTRVNRDVIKRIAKDDNILIEVGGGVRTREDIDDLLGAGVSRVVIGSKVIEDRNFVVDILQSFNTGLAVSLDCSEGFVAQHGWVETSKIKGVDLAKDLASMGLKYVIYTDIARDGTLAGPNIDGLKEMLAIEDLEVIASGGIKDVNDIKVLMELRAKNLFGVITGKAIYEGTLNLKEAFKMVEND